MRRLSLIAIALAPLALASVVTVALNLYGFLFFIFAFTFVPLLFVVLVASGVLLSLFVAGRREESQREGAAYLGALGAGLLIALLAFLPLMFASQSLVHAMRRPFRETVAQRVIADNVRSPAHGSEATLRGTDALLSDDGTIEVYSDATGVSVWFWDSRGLLGDYSASVYSSTSVGRQPAGGVAKYQDVTHESGHWWSSSGD